MTLPKVCFVGLYNLRALAPEFSAQPFGGAELQQTLLARALAKRGWPVSMVVLDSGQPEGAAWDGVQTHKAYRPDEGIPVIRFLHPRWTKLHAALRRADADVYYTSCAGAELGQIALFARRRGRKVVFRIASHSDCNPRELLVRYARDRLLYRYGLARADLVLAQTTQQQEALRRHYGRDSRLAPSLVEPAARCRPFEERDIDALWVGHLRSFKRPDVLLEVARRNPTIRFHMVGGRMPRSEALYDATRREAEALGNVTFHGAVPYRDVRSLYERARLFVGTSDIEGFPNTYLQAWSHGTPVVGFLDPDGLLARHGMGRAVSSVAAMCTAVTALTRERAQWEPASARAREYMTRQHGDGQVLAPYLAALTAAAGADLGGRSAGQPRVARG